nr:MAG TPA: hypothetical protein [Caudoviricetes sp.]DAK00532.1 MAG TPA: hypothetical protein [Caudoviricetes sp.]
MRISLSVVPFDVSSICPPRALRDSAAGAPRHFR